MFTAQNERFLKGWEARRGEPLADVPVAPPHFVGHPPCARLFSKAIAHFVIRVFHNRETQYYDQANDAIIRNSRYYIEHTDVRDDWDSFYWNLGEICRALLHFGTFGDEEPGLVSPEAEKVFNEMALGYCYDHSTLANADSRPNMTWRIRDSENHHVQKSSALWQMMMILIQHGYGSELLSDGATVQDHFRAWTDFFTIWMKERATHSMFVEVQSKVYGVHTMKNVYPLYDFAPTPELKELTGNFITLFWALWAQEQINGVQGGGQCRVYPDSASKSSSDTLHWSWYYTGLGEFHAPDEMDYVLLDCSYRLPQTIVDMIHHPEKRGTYTVESRPFGGAAPDDVPLDYRPSTDWGRIYRYSYCTPDYILGTLMCPQLTPQDWCLISSQNRFQGVTFAQMNAMVLPIPESEDLHTIQATVPTVGFNQFWSQQAEGTLITQRCRTYTAPMCVFFSAAGDVRTNVTEKDGWYFTYCGNAYAAVKICQGSFTWEDHPFAPGQWMRCDVPTTPVIVETANASQYATLADFQDAVTKLAPTWDGVVMKYHSLYGHDFVFVTDGDSEDSTIDGEYYVKKPDFSFKSPFVNGKWGGDEVKITFDGEELILKF